jgi:CheY-like chemotaxis protein
MRKETTILIAEDDEGHFSLIRKNLQRAGVENPIVRFADGQKALDFFFHSDSPPVKAANASYLLLLDIRMPKVDGIDVLRMLKKDPVYRLIPVIMVTTTDDPMEVDHCHRLGCSLYLVKPIEYESFTDAIQKAGSFFSILEVPCLDAAV